MWGLNFPLILLYSLKSFVYIEPSKRPEHVVKCGKIFPDLKLYNIDSKENKGRRFNYIYSIIFLQDSRMDMNEEATNDICLRRGSRDDTFHILYDCPHVSNFWNELINWLGNWERFIEYPEEQEFPEEQELLLG